MTQIDNKTRGLLIEVAKTAIEEYEQQRTNRAKLKVDNRLRNIKLLLKNYRKFKQHMDAAKEDIPKLQQALDINELSEESFEIKALLANRKRTAGMVVYIDRTLEIYERNCRESGSQDERSRYKIIHDLYLSDEKKSVDEIAMLHSIARRTVYYNVDQAAKALAVLMFGVDGVEFKEA